MELIECTLWLAYLPHVQNSAFYLIDINRDEGKSVWKSKDDHISEEQMWKSGLLITQWEENIKILFSYITHSGKTLNLVTISYIK